jgi:hypothetical protein
MSVRKLLVLSSCAVFFSAITAAAPAKVVLAGGAHATGRGCRTEQRTLASTMRASAPRSFDDYIQDTRGPDICGQNTMANDNEGVLTIGLHIHNRTSFVGSEAYGLFFDTDLNSTTGAAGAEYRVRLTSDGTVVGKWDGTKFQPTATLGPAEWKPGYGPVFQIKTSDLGDAKAFNFVIFATDGVNGDLAPNSGSWSYQLTPLELTIQRLAVEPAKAGRRFGARMGVVRGDLNAPLAEGTITCTAKLGAKNVGGTGSFAAGWIACSWQLPRSARGKRFAGTVAVDFQGVEARRSFSIRVR